MNILEMLVKFDLVDTIKLLPLVTFRALKQHAVLGGPIKRSKSHSYILALAFCNLLFVRDFMPLTSNDVCALLNNCCHCIHS